MTAQIHEFEGSPDFLKGVDAIAEFLGKTLGAKWTRRQIYYARERGELPIRHMPGIGLYAFGTELLNALKAPETLHKTALTQKGS
jgi:hypothetical protein